MTGPVVGVADEIQGADLAADRADILVRHIPDRHAVGAVAQGVVVRHDADPADDPSLEHPPHPAHHVLWRHTKFSREVMVRFFRERQASLSRLDQVPVQGIDGRILAHASNLRPTKNSSSLRMSWTTKPVSEDISASTRSISPGRSVARTNHMLSS